MTENRRVIPQWLSHLAIDKERGYVIPFFVPIRGGKPDFNHSDGKRWTTAMEKNICWICGKKLPKREWWLVSGPIGFANRIATDCPMHYRCAIYSLEVCPHLHYRKVERKTTELEHARRPYLMPDKPKYLLLIRADHVEPKWREFMYKYRPVTAVRWVYENNILAVDVNQISLNQEMEIAMVMKEELIKLHS